MVAFESVGGTQELTEKVLGRFVSDNTTFGPEVAQTLSEETLLIMSAHLPTNGFTTKQYEFEGKNRLGFLVTGTPTRVHRVGTRNTTLKIESRRFMQLGQGKNVRLGGGGERGRHGRDGVWCGHPRVQYRGEHRAGGSFDMGTTHGSGEWRTVVYEGPVVVYEMDATLAAEAFGSGRDKQTVTAEGTFVVYVPEPEADDFEQDLRLAAAAAGGAKSCRRCRRLRRCSRCITRRRP